MMRAVDKCYIGAAAMFEAGHHCRISPTAAKAIRAIRPIMESLSDDDRAMVLLTEALLLGDAISSKEQKEKHER
jgi:hypothetical protein